MRLVSVESNGLGLAWSISCNLKLGLARSHLDKSNLIKFRLLSLLKLMDFWYELRIERVWFIEKRAASDANESIRYMACVSLCQLNCISSIYLKENR